MSELQENLLPLHPAILIEPTMAGEDRFALELVGAAAVARPELLESAIDLYSQEPAIIEGVFEFLDSHPDGLQTLKAFVYVMRKKLDMEIEYDPSTEAAIEQDPYYLSVKRDFQQSINETRRDQFRTSMRTRRLKLFINRSRDAA